jgi:hypothetical protein
MLLHPDDARKLERAQIDLQLEQLAMARARRQLIEVGVVSALVLTSLAILIGIKLLATGAF